MVAQGADRIEVLVAGRIPDPEVGAAVAALISRHACIRHFPISFPVGDSSNKKNAGLRESRANLVAFIDDDVRVAPDWPCQVIRCFDRAEVGMYSGPSLVPDDVPLMARLSGMALASSAAGYVAERYWKGAGGLREIKWSRIIGCNMGFRKTVLESVGAFDPRFWPGEEMVASYRTAKSGSVIMFQPEAWVYHYPRATFRGFCRQIYGYGATRIRLVREGLEFEPMTVVPALWVAGLAVLALGAFLSPFCAQLLGLGLLCYLLFDGVVTLAIVLKTHRLVDALLIGMIPVMHLCYGVAEWIEWFRPNKDLSVKTTPPK